MMERTALSRARRFAIVTLACVHTLAAQHTLPSWNDGAARKAIIGFVERVTKPGGADFVPVPERIATFDNDGTLWSEQPIYFQFIFVLDRIKALAPQHPEWKSHPPFSAVLEGDRAAVAAAGEKGVLALIMATHAGMTTDEFNESTTGRTSSSSSTRDGTKRSRRAGPSSA